MHRYAPGVSHGVHDVEAPPVRRVGGLPLWDRVPGVTVADLDAHGPPVEGHEHGDFELGGCVLHRVGGQLGDKEYEVVRLVGAEVRQGGRSEAPGQADRGRCGREPACGGGRHRLDFARSHRGLPPKGPGSSIPVAVPLPEPRNPETRWDSGVHVTQGRLGPHGRYPAPPWRSATNRS